ncbi:hypothetical protein CEK25_006632 [Fusarium fujikuroi]|nr:hypothetical protein CEK25_006632 [Fusarium fujikuroi]
MVRASTIAATARNPQLRILNALRANGKSIMTFLGLPSLQTAQIVASTGVDAVIIDCEHGHIRDDSMHDATAAIAAAGVSPLVRLRMTHPDLIKRALDSGAHGISLPQVHTAQEATEVVKYSKFPPQGLRGQGSPFAGFAHNVDIATYVKTANETTIVCVQIESRQGVDNVDAICAVPGVDMAFIGLNDLAFSLLGYIPAKGDEPEFLDAIDKIVAAARKHGKWVARLSNSGALCKEHLDVFDTLYPILALYTSLKMFSSFRKGPDDPMYFLKRAADQDTSPDKVDLGVGIYRNESGLYGQLGSVAKAKIVLAENDPGHDSASIASAQTISGTGACHLAALALSQSISPRPQVFVGTPTWGNYKPMFELVGLKVIEYPYFDFQTRTIDFSSIITAALNVPPRSVFILQACCHNPTGADPTRDQWKELGAVLARNSHFVLFDIAYHGLGNGLDEDAYAIRHFATLGLDMFVCQSFSKNFALYGERCGALHAVCSSRDIAAVVQDRLRCLIRWEFSFAPAYGGRLATIVLDSDELTVDWVEDLSEIQHRLKALRKQLHHRLAQVLKTPGNWDHILRENGLFSYLSLNPKQCQTLIDQHHIYLPPNGRINISGLSQSNISRVADSLDQIILEEAGQDIQTRAAFYKMLACRNSLKTRVANGQLCKALGVRLVSNPQVVQLAKNANFDSLFIDLEHSTLSLDDAGKLCGTGLALGITPFVRVPHQCGNGFIQKVLDAGAMGIIFPHVQNEDEAEAAVAISKYPPQGCRSITGQLPAFSLKPYPQADVIRETNEHASTVFVMIENECAVQKVEETAAVDGVDVVLVGSNDLAIELGAPADFRSDRFRQALMRVSEACRKYEKVMGLAGIYDTPDIQDWAIHTLGVRFMLCQQDSGLFAGAAAKCLAAVEMVENASSSKSMNVSS